MPYDIETTHEWLDEIERVSGSTSGIDRKSWVEPELHGNLWEIITELEDSEELPNLGSLKGVAHSIKNFQAVTANDLSLVLERLRTHIKSWDQPVHSIDLDSANTELATDDDIVSDDGHSGELAHESPVTLQSNSVEASEWVIVPSNVDLKSKINELSTLLDEIVVLARSSNVPKEEAALSEIERAQLIAILETAILVLKGPMVEVGLLKKIGQKSGEVVESVAKKQSENALGKLIEKVPGIISKILENL